MEGPKKCEHSKSWLKKLTRYKINNDTRNNSLTTSHEDIDSSITDRVIRSATKSDEISSGSRRKSHNVFGSLRRVHNRVKLYVSSKRKIRTLDSKNGFSAFASQTSLDVSQRNRAATSNTSEVIL